MKRKLSPPPLRPSSKLGVPDYSSSESLRAQCGEDVVGRERVDRLCTERHPGVWHNGRSPRHVDASHDFFILYFLRMSSAREGGGAALPDL